MHEISIAMNLIESVEFEAKRRSLSKIEAVHLRLGRLSGVDRGALSFAYTLASEGTAFAGSRLIIEEVPVEVRCSGCGAERMVPDGFDLRCPRCANAPQDILRGREIELSALEVDS